MNINEIIDLYKEIIRGKDQQIAEINRAKDEISKKNDQLIIAKDQINKIKSIK